MAQAGITGSLYCVAPTAENSYVPPVLVNTNTSVTVGNGATTVVTSATLPPGTYLVGGNFSVSSTTVFTASDTLNMRIHDAAGSLVYYPQSALTGYSALGNTPSAVVNTVSGVLVLTTSGSLIWDVNCSFTTSTGKSSAVSYAYYQRIA